MAIGWDAGTYNLVCCKRDKDGNFVNKKEVNAFIEMPLENRFVFNMMKAAGVPLIERKEAGVAYALGESAVNIAYTMNNLELKRPMKDGCLNPKEKYAQQILSIMIHSLLDEVSQKNETLYYSVPANAINQETDADYHGKVLKAIFDAFQDESGNTVNAQPINEALALVYAELAHKSYTGIACSFGAGMCNVCYSIFGAPAFQFSIVNSGDWIDKQAAKATGESIAYINKEKQKVDLSEKYADSLVHRAIKAQYELMIKKAADGLKQGFEKAGNKARSDQPLDIIIAGGTSLPNGFDKLFSDAVAEAHLPIQIATITRPADPLFSVARGCLIAAEAAGQ